MKLITLDDMGSMFGWRGHSAYFNTQQYGFPEPKNLTADGDKLYDYNEVYSWDKDRPLKPIGDNNTGNISHINNII